ncbi:MAG: hypothetical protein AAF646_03975 [Pseudomonadota bacterium]
MPDLTSIMTLYQMHATATSSGAMEAEADEVAASAMEAVARGFLSKNEAADWPGLSSEAQAARLRLGRQRLRRWEMANPDIASLLRRKARIAAAG